MLRHPLTLNTVLRLAKDDEQVSIKVKHGNWEANVSDDEIDDGDVEYQHAVEAEHRCVLFSTPVTREFRS